MLLTSNSVEPDALERGTGWLVKPQGACKGDVCVPLPASARNEDGTLSVAVLAERLGMPLVVDAEHGLSALGPDTVTGQALTTAAAPDLELPTVDGEPFRLASLRGTNVALISWASW
jgi:hypothetical protein